MHVVFCTPQDDEDEDGDDDEAQKVRRAAHHTARCTAHVRLWNTSCAGVAARQQISYGAR